MKYKKKKKKKKARSYILRSNYACVVNGSNYGYENKSDIGTHLFWSLPLQYLPCCCVIDKYEVSSTVEAVLFRTKYYFA